MAVIIEWEGNKKSVPNMSAAKAFIATIEERPITIYNRETGEFKKIEDNKKIRDKRYKPLTTITYKKYSFILYEDTIAVHKKYFTADMKRPDGKYESAVIGNYTTKEEAIDETKKYITQDIKGMFFGLSLKDNKNIKRKIKDQSKKDLISGLKNAGYKILKDIPESKKFLVVSKEGNKMYWFYDKNKIKDALLDIYQLKGYQIKLNSLDKNLVEYQIYKNGSEIQSSVGFATRNKAMLHALAWLEKNKNVSVDNKKINNMDTMKTIIKDFDPKLIALIKQMKADNIPNHKIAMNLEKRFDADEVRKALSSFKDSRVPQPGDKLTFRNSGIFYKGVVVGLDGDRIIWHAKGRPGDIVRGNWFTSDIGKNITFGWHDKKNYKITILNKDGKTIKTKITDSAKEALKIKHRITDSKYGLKIKVTRIKDAILIKSFVYKGRNVDIVKDEDAFAWWVYANGQRLYMDDGFSTPNEAISGAKNSIDKRISQGYKDNCHKTHDSDATLVDDIYKILNSGVRSKSKILEKLVNVYGHDTYVATSELNKWASDMNKNGSKIKDASDKYIYNEIWEMFVQGDDSQTIINELVKNKGVEISKAKRMVSEIGKDFEDSKPSKIKDVDTGALEKEIRKLLAYESSMTVWYRRNNLAWKYDTTPKFVETLITKIDGEVKKHKIKDDDSYGGKYYLKLVTSNGSNKIYTMDTEESAINWAKEMGAKGKKVTVSKGLHGTIIYKTRDSKIKDWSKDLVLALVKKGYNARDIAMKLVDPSLDDGDTYLKEKLAISAYAQELINSKLKNTQKNRFK